MGMCDHRYGSSLGVRPREVKDSIVLSHFGGVVQPPVGPGARSQRPKARRQRIRLALLYVVLGKKAVALLEWRKPTCLVVSNAHLVTRTPPRCRNPERGGGRGRVGVWTSAGAVLHRQSRHRDSAPDSHLHQQVPAAQRRAEPAARQYALLRRQPSQRRSGHEGCVLQRMCALRDGSPDRVMIYLITIF
jgi:hypothetical protein